MSLRSLELLAGAGLTRREMLGALARWTAPTVLTIALAARPAAAASCPPCTKTSGGRCRACTMNQILNCQCEPCLGAPYCANGVRAPTARPLGSVSSGGQGYPGPGSGTTPREQLDPYLRLLQRGRPSAGDDPFNLNRNPIYRSPFAPSPFGGSRPYGRLPGDSARARTRGLYERLRPDERRPF